MDGVRGSQVTPVLAVVFLSKVDLVGARNSFGMPDLGFLILIATCGCRKTHPTPLSSHYVTERIGQVAIARQQRRLQAPDREHGRDPPPANA